MITVWEMARTAINQHSEYSPSRLSRIIACPGSVSLCAEVPQKPASSYAAEGTLLHSYMEQTLSSWPEVADLAFDPQKEIEYTDAITDCIEYVQKFVDLNNHPGIKKFIEVKVSMREVDEVYGTLDLGIVLPNELHIFDWKFGRGVLVSAKDNPQLLSYLDGMLNVCTKSGINLPADSKLFIHVVQPRIQNYQCEEVSYEDLAKHTSTVQKAITLSKGKNPPFNPGPEQCKWCDAAAICKTRVSQTQLDIEAAFAAVVDIENNHANIDDVLAIYKKKADIEVALKQIQQYIYLEMAKGRKIEGYKFVRGRANRIWGPNATIEAISDLYPDLPVEAFIETKLTSPAKLEKLIPKKERQALEALIIKPEGALSIAPIDSPKEEVQVANLEEIYSSITDGNAEE